jgi:outer membrane lipoprotein SlyB
MKSLLILFVVSMLAGCASRLDGDTYSRGEARREMRVTLATVESVRPVQIEGTKSGVGKYAGAAIGGIAGSNIGHGRESVAGAVLGGVVGGVAGSAIEEGATRTHGVEVMIRLENGELRAIVQTDDGEDFQLGERVRLIKSGSNTRVAR